MDTLTQFFIDNSTIFYMACSFMLLDIATGLAKAAKEKNYSSEIMRLGLFHKFAFIAVMVASAVLEIGLTDPHVSLTFDFPLFDIVCAYVILTEFTSIAENACKINPQLNNFLGKYIADKQVISND